MVNTNKQALTVSRLGTSGSNSRDSSDLTRTLSRTTKRDLQARNENGSGEGVLEVHRRIGLWWYCKWSGFMPPPQSTEMKTGIRKRRTAKNCQQNKVNAEQRRGFLQHPKKVRQAQRSMPGKSRPLQQRFGVHVQVTAYTSHNKGNVEVLGDPSRFRR